MSKYRKKYVDVVGGVMILWMMFGHLQQVTGFNFDCYNLLFFFMPWFYYKSGALSKEKDILDIISINKKKLIIPFLLYGILGQIILLICLFLENEITLRHIFYVPIRSLLLGGTIPGNPPLWFIPSLFITLCISAYMYTKRVSLYVTLLIGLILGIIFSQINCVYMPVYIASSCFGLFFYTLGKILHKYEKDWKVLLCASLICIILLFFNKEPFVEIRFIASIDKLSIISFLHGTIIASCGCLIINGIFSYLQPLLKFPILQYVGRNAMDFYVLHWIVLLVIARFIMGDLLYINDPKLQFIFAGLGCIIVIPIFVYIKTFRKKTLKPQKDTVH